MTHPTNTPDPMANLKARAMELARTTQGSGRAKTPRPCACGCKGLTRGGTWLPGHDAKALSRLLAEARATLASASAPAPNPTERVA